jgi:hypothetical protein
MPASEKGPQTTGLSNKWCWAALALVMICAGLIRVRLLAIPLERDEGEYAYIAQQILQGVPPYASGYSLKLPGIDAAYALILVVFGQTQTAIHMGLLMANLAAILLVFLFAKKLFNPVAGTAAAASFAIMSLGKSVMGLSANAEHFVILPALAGVLFIHRIAEKRRYCGVLAAGLLMGLAFIIKQHGIFFAVFGAVYLLYNDLRHIPIQWKKCIVSQIIFGAGVATPFAVTCLLMRQTGVFKEFWFWTFTYAYKYVTSMPLYLGRQLFRTQSSQILAENILIWLFAMLGLLIVLLRSHFRVRAFFIVSFLVFSFLTICPGYYFRGHYFIMLLPVAAILAGAGFYGLFELLTGHCPGFLRGLVITLAGIAVAGFSLFSQRVYLFELSPTGVCRLIYDGNPFPESLEIAKYIKENTSPADTIAVFGSEPQIYFYSKRRAATRYIYAYQLMDRNEFTFEMQEEMVREIVAANPELVILVNVQASWIVKPESVPVIFEWSNGYVDEFFDTAGIIEIPEEGQTIYRWGAQAAGYSPGAGHWIGVYKRKH